jgi:excisionase family DNA binding protein
MEEETMTVQQVAAALHVSVSTVHRFVSEGHLAPVGERAGVVRRQPAYRFRVSDVEHLKAHPPARKPRVKRD